MKYKISYVANQEVITEEYDCEKAMGVSAPFIVLFIKDKEVLFSMNDVVKVEREVGRISVSTPQLVS